MGSLEWNTITRNIVPLIKLKTELNLSKYQSFLDLCNTYRDMFKLYTALKVDKCLAKSSLTYEIIPLWEKHEQMLKSKLKATKLELINRLLPSTEEHVSSAEVEDRKDIMKGIRFCGNALKDIVRFARFSLLLAQSDQMCLVGDEVKDTMHLVNDMELQNRFAVFIAKMKTEFGDTLRRTLWRYEHSAKTDMDLRKMAKTLEVLDSNLRLLLDVCSNQEHYDLFDDFFAKIKARLEGDNKNNDNNDSHIKPYIISVKLIGLRSNLIKTKSFLQHLQDKVRAVYERSDANKKTLKSKSNKSLQVSPP